MGNQQMQTGNQDVMRHSILKNEPSITGTSWFSGNNGGGNRNWSNMDTINALADLNAEQLKERLLVAETMMKRLYSRMKELE